MFSDFCHCRGQRSRARLKETSEELKIQNQELAYSETKFKSLSDASFEGIIFTKENILLEHNSAIFDMFGYDTDEILTGRSVIEFVAPEARQEVNTENKSLNTLRLMRPAQSKRMVRSFLLKYGEGCLSTTAVSYVFRLSRDITEQKKAYPGAA